MSQGKKWELQNDTTFSNGVIVMKDGTVKQPNSTTAMLKNGWILMWDGTLKEMKKPEDMQKNPSTEVK